MILPYNEALWGTGLCPLKDLISAFSVTTCQVGGSSQQSEKFPWNFRYNNLGQTRFMTLTQKRISQLTLQRSLDFYILICRQQEVDGVTECHSSTGDCCHFYHTGSPMTISIQAKCLANLDANISGVPWPCMCNQHLGKLPTQLGPYALQNLCACTVQPHNLYLYVAWLHKSLYSNAKLPVKKKNRHATSGSLLPHFLQAGLGKKEVTLSFLLIAVG